MKVDIGPFNSYYGTYDIVYLLKHFGVSQDRCEAIADSLPAWLNEPFNYFHRRWKRKEYVRIDEYDTWSMDHTLALIILPMLKQLKVNNHGYGFVDQEDAPGIEEGPARWDFVMDEMIWAFDQYTREDNDEPYPTGDFLSCWADLDGEPGEPTEPTPEQIKNIEEYRAASAIYHERKKKALILFGKYYNSLWD